MAIVLLGAVETIVRRKHTSPPRREEGRSKATDDTITNPVGGAFHGALHSEEMRAERRVFDAHGAFLAATFWAVSGEGQGPGAAFGREAVTDLRALVDR